MPALTAPPIASRTASLRQLAPHIDPVTELRCECGRPGCRATVPIAAESARGVVGRLIVVPAHADRGTVTRAADNYFVLDVTMRRDAATTSVLRASFTSR